MQLPEFLSVDDDGEVRFSGHRLRLIEVVNQFNQGHSAETIALDIFPTLELATIYKAIAFYLENQAEVDALAEENDKEIERQASVPGATPSLVELRKRLESKQRAEAS